MLYAPAVPRAPVAAPTTAAPTTAAPESGLSDAPPVDRHRRVTAFDGLRGVAVLAVMAYHFRPFGLFPGGWIGVDVFFALSGFLITGLLLRELAEAGTIHLRRFHARRLLRLQPALLLFLGVWLLVLARTGGPSWFSTVPGFPAQPGHVPLWLGVRGVIGGAAEVSNWLNAFQVHMPPLGHLWSLAIEEQFYVVWPVLLLVIMRRRPGAALAVTVGLAAASALLGPLLAHHGADPVRIDFGTDTRGQALFLGAAGAQLWHSGALDRVLRHRLTRPVLLSASVFLALTCLLLPDGSSLRLRGGYTVIDTAATVLVVALAAGMPLAGARVLSWPPLVYVGSRSYALYLWNYAFATWTHSLGLLGIVAGVTASFVAAEASYRLVERHALKLKARLA